MPKPNIRNLPRKERLAYAGDLLKKTALSKNKIARMTCLGNQVVSRINQPREIRWIKVRSSTRAVLEKRLANAIVFAEKFLIANKNVSPQALVNLIVKTQGGDLYMGYRCVRELERRGLVKRSAVGYKRVGSKTKVVIERRRMVKELLDSGLDLPEIVDKMKISFGVVRTDFFALDTIESVSIEERIEAERKRILELIQLNPRINSGQIASQLGVAKMAVYRRITELLAENPRILNDWRPASETVQLREKRILDLIREKPGITASEISQSLGINVKLIRETIRAMREMNPLLFSNWHPDNKR